ncbi:hypothetical protein NDU88_002135 [Pleurodeles waltl]|uniref:Uncharacterized protein n=1 Tax=Pleurodeles waltl TaxID=8319 RepID=A0AAV7RB15_PLEWA|nr:hypothetical protein NDU88_002135 [Pleurodeles waltl]
MLRRPALRAEEQRHYSRAGSDPETRTPIQTSSGGVAPSQENPAGGSEAPPDHLRDVATQLGCDNRDPGGPQETLLDRLVHCPRG